MVASTKAQTAPKSPPSWDETSRKIGELRARDASARDASHFAAVFTTRAGPFRLRQILPRDALLLYAAANPLFNGRPARFCRPGEILAFVKLLSGWRPAGWVPLRMALLLFSNKRRARTYDALDAFVRETFVDAPAATGGGGGGSVGVFHASFLSGLFHIIAKTYHWSLAELYATPLRELLLFRKHILADLQIAAGRTLSDTSHEELALRGEFLNAKEAWEKQQAMVNAAAEAKAGLS